MSTYRIHLDQATCAQTGYCVALAPGLFCEAEDGTVTPVTGAVGPESLGLLEEAETLCPTSAISATQEP